MQSSFYHVRKQTRMAKGSTCYRTGDILHFSSSCVYVHFYLDRRCKRILSKQAEVNVFLSDRILKRVHVLSFPLPKAYIKKKIKSYIWHCRYQLKLLAIWHSVCLFKQTVNTLQQPATFLCLRGHLFSTEKVTIRNHIATIP